MENISKTNREETINLFDMRLYLIVMGKKWVMNLIEKKLHLVLLLFILLFLVFFYGEGRGKELDENPSNNKPFILVLYPKVVTIENSDGVDTLLMLINLRNKCQISSLISFFPSQLLRILFLCVS